MRPVAIGDVITAARALLSVPETERPNLVRCLMMNANTALAYHVMTGRPHPTFGTGSLMSASSRITLAKEPELSDPAYRAALVTVLEALGS